MIYNFTRRFINLQDKIKSYKRSYNFTRRFITYKTSYYFIRQVIILQDDL